MEKCPRCNGVKTIKLFYRPDVMKEPIVDREVKCWVCNGSGIIKKIRMWDKIKRIIFHRDYY